jgi:hypothetical protein
MSMLLGLILPTAIGLVAILIGLGVIVKQGLPGYARLIVVAGGLVLAMYLYYKMNMSRY